MHDKSTARTSDGGVVGGSSGFSFKIRHISLTEATLSELETRVARVADQGFSHLCVGGIFAATSSGLVRDHDQSPFAKLDAASLIGRLRSACDRRGVTLGIDVVLDRMAADGPSARALAGAYRVSHGLSALDPRHATDAAETALLQADGATQAADWWAHRLDAFARAGAAAFRLMGLPGLPPSFLPALAEARRGAAALLAWTPGLDWSRHHEIAACRPAAVFASTSWWDGRGAWYAEECAALARLAPVVGVAGSEATSLLLAAATTDGLFVGGEALCATPDATPCRASRALAPAITLADRLAGRRLRGGVRALTGPGSPLTMLLRADATGHGVAILFNPGSTAQATSGWRDALPPTAGVAASIQGKCPDTIAPGEVAVVDVAPTAPIVSVPRKAGARKAAKDAARQSPIVIDQVQPTVSGGPFAAKHIVGRPLAVEADIFADGHDQLAAEIVWWPHDGAEEGETGSGDGRPATVPLVPLGNDRWQATLTPSRIGRHYFSVAAWRDEWGSLIHGLELKHRAGVDTAVEREEAALFLAALDDDGLRELARQARAATPDAAVAMLSAERVRAAVAGLAPRRFRAEAGPFPVDVERPQAEFAAWYELFPRSLTDDPARHGTFDDVIAALPRVRAMGFDVLYFPPIHPIGQSHRKGRNNSLTAAPGDVGSPYAIGAAEGGHDSIHPALGTFADFRRLIAAARAQDLEIALDFAIQCSPDHPWLREHPGWFRRRPDGTIKYAENPPKKYEDIVNVDFYAEEAVPGLWLALRDIVLLWVGEGVRLFRVDNPHTKPLPFWQWMIGDVRARHPDVIFLSEAFTRPKVMHRLAKVGFSQSYTYFTWRNGKQEITDYLRELSSPPVVDFFRPHFFVNTPDINPIFLQTSGRPGFLIRAALAATLSGLWGVYSGFEICEAAALPGKEEYLDSEKYEIRRREFTAPGNIVAEITLLNRLRRAHPALQSHRNVTFYNAFNDRILLYGKRAPGANDMILVAVSLDPHAAQEAGFELPLWEWRLPDDGALTVDDLVRGGGSVWRGKHQHLRLEPAMPFAIWRLSPEVPP